jgi:hypothetical protein
MAVAIEEARLVTVVIPAPAVAVIPAIVVPVVRAPFVNHGRMRFDVHERRRCHFDAAVGCISVTARGAESDDETQYDSRKHFITSMR